MVIENREFDLPESSRDFCHLLLFSELADILCLMLFTVEKLFMHQLCSLVVHYIFVFYTRKNDTHEFGMFKMMHCSTVKSIHCHIRIASKPCSSSKTIYACIQ